MLFKNVDEIKEHISFLGQTNVSGLKPHILRAEHKYIRKYIGKSLLQTLNTYVNTEQTEPDEKNEALLEYIRPAVASFAVYLGVSQSNIVLTNSGFATTQTTSLVPASKQRTDDLKAELLESAWDSIEALLQFLEENKNDYQEWVSSEAYSLANRNLINSAVQFFNLLDLDVSRLLFARLRAVMDNVELLTIARHISPELLATIKAEMLSGQIDPKNASILPDLRRALANLTMADYIPEQDTEKEAIMDKYIINDERRKHYENIGMQFLAVAVNTIKANVDDYPAYKSSSIYISAQAAFKNEAENGFFSFGG